MSEVVSLVAEGSVRRRSGEEQRDLWWCACGRSKLTLLRRQPRGAPASSRRWIATADRNVPFCGCKLHCEADDVRRLS